MGISSQVGRHDPDGMEAITVFACRADSSCCVGWVLLGSWGAMLGAAMLARGDYRCLSKCSAFAVLLVNRVPGKWGMRSTDGSAG
ncbi:hypothetical protein [Trueperella sp. LYQ141]|uniref:hypothetical protein n=1 Tax=Trueperella sp. LYQ141 TaxID=3391058 RepID=UPI00398360E5